MAAQRSDYWKRVEDYKKLERSEIEKDRRHPLNNALEQCSDVIVRLRQPQLQAINKWKRELALKPLTCIHEYLLRFMDFKQEDLDPHRDLICRTWSSLSEFDEIVQRITSSGACEVPCSRIHVSLPFFGCMDPGVDSNDLDRGMHNVELLKEEIAQAIHRSSLKVVYSQSAASSETATLLQHKVGVAFRLGKLLQCIADGSISVVAIIGESGLGKTTLLEAAVQMIQGTKDYVVAAIQINRELRKEQLLDLQSQLIRQLGGAQKKLRDLEQGRLVIQRLMRMLKEQGKRVCLAIDNVVHSSDLKEALPENLAELLPISTCIFITTRSEAVAHDLQKLFEKALPSGFSYFLHKPAQLTHLECMDLFSFYATKSQGPLEEKHENMIDLIVSTCEGLPLALILLGSYFDLGKNRKMAAWINVAQRLQHGQVTGTPQQMIFTILEVVFESLQPPDLQESFLDVVLFFHGHDWNTVQYSVGKNILQELVARHLIFQEVHLEAVLGKKNYHLPQRIFDKDCGSSFVGVHDLIYDFARSKKDALELRSGLLISEANDIPSADDPVLERVRGLSLRECTVKGRQLEQMLSLKLLSLQDVVLSGPEIESLSERVAYVNWRLCRQGRNRNKVSALPMNNMEELNVLHLHASKGEINIVHEVFRFSCCSLQIHEKVTLSSITKVFDDHFKKIGKQEVLC
ncbi:hypothetical protein O6H91_Y221200 [Diphasiastrum complanatum]|nr:hypothetical protein O6H91_Y221200 [Diphasiastrum complanatum]